LLKAIHVVEILETVDIQQADVAYNQNQAEKIKENPRKTNKTKVLMRRVLTDGFSVNDANAVVDLIDQPGEKHRVDTLRQRLLLVVDLSRKNAVTDKPLSIVYHSY
jgi:hypothetical protein